MTKGVNVAALNTMHQTPQANGMLRIAFELPRDPDDPDWPPSSAETMWASRVGADVAIIMNVPFYVRELSYGDTVVYRVGATASVYEFERILKRGGHSTYRILFTGAKGQEAFAQWWLLLEEIGCTYERADDDLVAIDVPPGVDVAAVYRILEEGERQDVWGFEEGYYFTQMA